MMSSLLTDFDKVVVKIKLLVTFIYTHNKFAKGILNSKRTPQLTNGNSFYLQLFDSYWNASIFLLFHSPWHEICL